MACIGLCSSSVNTVLARSSRSLHPASHIYRSRSYLKVRASTAHRTMVAAAQATETATLACGCFWSPVRLLFQHSRADQTSACQRVLCMPARLVRPAWHTHACALYAPLRLGPAKQKMPVSSASIACALTAGCQVWQASGRSVNKCWLYRRQ